MTPDIIIVGAGIVGSSIAHLAAFAGKNVLIIDRRSTIAGNLYDEKINGILVQKYGPHCFHTNDEQVYNFITRFGDWTHYELRCQVFMNDKSTPSPFNFQTIDDYFTIEQASEIKSHINEFFNGALSATILDLLNCEDVIIRNFAQFLYKNDYEPYTCKQWNISPLDIDKSILARVPVVFSYENRYFNDKYQILPKNGYTTIINAMLSHRNITKLLNTDALSLIRLTADHAINFNGIEQHIPIIYTGPIDELFGYKFGALPYRSLHFNYKVIDKASFQDSAVIAYPQKLGYTRITEYTKLPKQNVGNRTIIAVEYPEDYSPSSGNEPYYPILYKDSVSCHEQYKSEASLYHYLHLCGRLADYKYYNMDQALRRALNLWAGINL